MASERKDGGPAFGHGNHSHGGNPGMSLRDWFAGQALAGLAARSIYTREALAKEAYEYADAMLAHRNTEGEQE